MKNIYTICMKVKVILVFFFLALSTSLKADHKYYIYCDEARYVANTVDGQLYWGTFKTQDFNAELRIVDDNEKTVEITEISDERIEPNIVEDWYEGKVYKYRINANKDVTFCITIKGGDNPTATISEHSLELSEEKEATCSECGYKIKKCNHCPATEKIITSLAIGHKFGEWKNIENGKYRVCENDESHIQYDMAATDVASLIFTLNDGTKLAYPYTLTPTMTMTSNSVEVTFGTANKVSTIRTADIKDCSAITYHNKNGYHQNEDNTYSHKCDYEGCDYIYNDLFVKNADEYIAANKDNGTIKVDNINLTDAKGYDCKADITAGNVSYTRMMNNRWATLCLPFDLPGNTNEYEFYELESVTSESVTLKKIEGNVAAGTPVLLRRTDKDGSKEFTFAAENIPMATQVHNVSTIDGLTLTGTFSTIEDLAAKDYVISHDNFYTVEWLKQNLTSMGAAKIAPFHAYIKQDGSMYNNAKYSLSTGGTTAINMLNAIESNSNATYYDINGHRIMGLQKGINIVKTGNVTKKVIIQ